MKSDFKDKLRNKRILDKNTARMIKYIGIPYRVERKEYRIANRQRVWVIGCKPGQGSGRESASGSELFLSDK